MNSVYWASAISVTIGLAFIGLIWKFGTWYGAVNADRSKFDKAIDGISDKVDQILVRLPPPSLVTIASSLRLTDLGERISRETGTVEWAESEYC